MVKNKLIIQGPILELKTKSGSKDIKNDLNGPVPGMQMHNMVSASLGCVWVGLFYIPEEMILLMDTRLVLLFLISEDYEMNVWSTVAN